jgi:protein gp37
MTTAIQWTDETWNPVTGCSKVSPGCAHCYAEGVAKRFWPTQYVDTVERGLISARDYKGDRMTGRLRAFTDVMTHEYRLEQPLHWKKPRRVFVNSMSDLFHEDVPFAFIDRVFATMALTPRHTFQVLTKRAGRMLEYMSVASRTGRWLNAAWDAPVGNDALRATQNMPLPNVWLGVSVENQHFADERIPLLLQTPAAVRFISAEPLLGPVDLTALSHNGRCLSALTGYDGDDSVEAIRSRRHLDWVIVGGESGPDARPCDIAWVRFIVQRCYWAAVPCFVKQLGSLPDDGTQPVGGIDLKDRKGGDPDEWPEDLRVRQFPEVRP